MSLFGAKVGKVDQSGGIVGLNFEDPAHGHALKGFAGFENGQRAFEAACVEVAGSGIAGVCHGRNLAGAETFVEPIVKGGDDWGP